MNLFLRLLLTWDSWASYWHLAADSRNQFRDPKGSGVLEGACPPYDSMVKPLPGTRLSQVGMHPRFYGASAFS